MMSMIDRDDTRTDDVSCLMSLSSRATPLEY
jgi:hypothetical protein